MKITRDSIHTLHRYCAYILCEDVASELHAAASDTQVLRSNRGVTFRKTDLRMQINQTVDQISILECIGELDRDQKDRPSLRKQFEE